MLLSKHCPHTGVVNFYDASEPHIAIGSITKSASAPSDHRFTWRFYALDSAPSGYAADEVSAKAKLVATLCKAERQTLKLH